MNSYYELYVLILVLVVGQYIANMLISMSSDRRQLPPIRDLKSDIEETAAFMTGKG